MASDEFEMRDLDADGDFCLPPPERASWSELSGEEPSPDEAQHWMALPKRQHYQGTLWHYTDIAGALAIIETGVLRATAIPFLNDTNEFRQGLRVLDLTNRALQASRHVHPAQKKVVSQATEAVNRVSVQADLHVACASEVPDSLSQWRSYGGSSGVAIGLDTESYVPVLLDRNADQSEPLPLRIGALGDVNWKRVAYGDEASYEHLLEVLAFICYSCPAPASSPDESTAFAENFATPVLMEAVAQCKDAAFVDEREVRAVVRRPIDTKPSFRVGAYGPTPYLDLTFTDAPPPLTEVAKPLRVTRALPLPVAGVNVGPGPHAETTALGLQLLLSKVGIEPPRGVQMSTVPYR